MSNFTFKNSGENAYELSGTLDFETVPQVLSKAAGLFTPNTRLHIDLGGVTDANSAAMALLIEWKSLAGADGSEIHFTNIPSQIERLAKVCKIDDLLQS